MSFSIPGYSEEIQPTEIFVFGSNLAGIHGKGAALCAVKEHGAKRGQGEGPQGRSYAIPTKDHRISTLPLSEIKKGIRSFLIYAEKNPDLKFNVTRIGCGLAGYRDEDIAPMFRERGPNVRIHPSWQKVLGE